MNYLLRLLGLKPVKLYYLTIICPGGLIEFTYRGIEGPSERYDDIKTIKDAITAKKGKLVNLTSQCGNIGLSIRDKDILGYSVKG